MNINGLFAGLSPDMLWKIYKAYRFCKNFDRFCADAMRAFFEMLKAWIPIKAGLAPADGDMPVFPSPKHKRASKA